MYEASEINFQVTLIGGFLYPAVVGAMASLISNINAPEQEFDSRRKRLNQYMAYVKFSKELTRKINRFYDYLWSRQRGVDEQHILDDLPRALKMAVQDSINGTIIREVPFFFDISLEFLRHLLAVLKPSVFLPGDIIITAGEVCHT